MTNTPNTYPARSWQLWHRYRKDQPPRPEDIADAVEAGVALDGEWADDVHDYAALFFALCDGEDDDHDEP